MLWVAPRSFRMVQLGLSCHEFQTLSAFDTQKLTDQTKLFKHNYSGYIYNLGMCQDHSRPI